MIIHAVRERRINVKNNSGGTLAPALIVGLRMMASISNASTASKTIPIKSAVSSPSDTSILVEFEEELEELEEDIGGFCARRGGNGESALLCTSAST